MRTLILLLIITCCLPWASAALPSNTVPDGLGVNIHFTGEPARDLDMIQAAGWRFIRMDFDWNSIEKQKGVYNFAAYDQLTNGLLKRNIRPVYILDYGNEVYQERRSVRTPEGLQAFARFAAAAAEHYRGKPIIWELWNEPNAATFWGPAANPDEYMTLAKIALPAMRKADPEVVCVGPALAGMDFAFLEACLRQGLLNLVDGISVHAYRRVNPEDAVTDIMRIRALIRSYRPDRPDFPILSGEWGYSTVWNGLNDAIQGQYLPREYLTNLSQGIPLSIWYDWHDDGSNPTNHEHHFGTVTLNYTPKPSYLAMQRLVAALNGMHFVKRLSSTPADYFFLFTDGTKSTIAAWTTGEAHQAQVLPGQQMTLTGDPQYFPVPATATAIATEACWTVSTVSPGVLCGSGTRGLPPAFTVHVVNPFTTTMTVRLATRDLVNLSGAFAGKTEFTVKPGKQVDLVWHGTTPPRVSNGDYHITVTAIINGISSSQQVRFVPINPITMRLVGLRDGAAAIIHMAHGDRFTGKLIATISVTKHILALQFDQAAGKYLTQGDWLAQTFINRGDIVIPLPKFSGMPGAIKHVQLQLQENGAVVAEAGPLDIQPIPVSASAIQLSNDGDVKVPARFSLTDTTDADPASPAGKALHFTFDYSEGWKFIRMDPVRDILISTPPKAVGVWVKGNTTGCFLNTRLVDATGRYFQANLGTLDFDGWRYLTADLSDPSQLGQWGGNENKRTISYPAHLYTLVLVDGLRRAVKGEVEFAGFHLIYPPNTMTK
ncbi:MAG TPA: cellulase family glycosylhydrolase [Armatimonadota bacterium]|nr:cellulase family glycosylhydrolase [Armatimonadota bacterium]